MQILRGVLLLIALVGLWWAYEAGRRYAGPHEELVGPVTHVRDGDTIEVSGRPIRLSGLTCDEKSASRGAEATRTVRRLVTGQTLTCVLTGERSHDRAVGRCRLEDGRDVGATLIARGVCGRCSRYDPFRAYAAVQREAGSFTGEYPGYCVAPW